VNDVLTERIRRKLDAMPYAQRAAGAPAFQKVAETLEDTMRAGRVPITIINGTMDAVGKAGRFFEGLAAAGKAAVDEATRKAAEKPVEKPVEETKSSQ
jgi:hypothetical protein